MPRKRSDAARPQVWSRRQQLTMVGISLLFLLPGLVFTVGTTTTKLRLSEKADRLRANGVPVIALVSDRRNTTGRGGGADTITVTYNYQGMPYGARILCGRSGGCFNSLGQQMTIWVNPANAGEFVDDNGITDDSMSFFNAWGGLVFGLLAAAIGGVLLFLAAFANRIGTNVRNNQRHVNE